MRSPVPVYPVDRYLVRSNVNNELVNITNEEVLDAEPALRPEDEITLRKLHDMLRSTADDLKLLSGELSNYHKPRIQVKTAPTPLDEEFNEKVHIEEVVNAKFHGYKIIDGKKVLPAYVNIQKDVVDGLIKTIADKPKRHVVTTGVQVNNGSFNRSANKKTLVQSQTKTLNINNTNEHGNNINAFKKHNVVSTPSVSYNEICFVHNETNDNLQVKNNLQLQELPSINIRNELKIQKIFNIDIIPDNKNIERNINENNIAVQVMKHASGAAEIDISHKISNHKHYNVEPHSTHKHRVRKIYKMDPYGSSESTANATDFQPTSKEQKQHRKTFYKTRLPFTRNKEYLKSNSNNQESRRPCNAIDEWKRKLNEVYGRPTTSKTNKRQCKPRKETTVAKEVMKSAVEENCQSELNNLEYIPYSKFTLGGVPVSDIEKEIENLPNKGDVPLRPILDKILNSRENSFYNSPRKKNDTNKKILTASDENLLKEVLDIQNRVSSTLSENIENKLLSEGSNDTYADDFDDENTNSPKHSPRKASEGDKSASSGAISSEKSSNNQVISGSKLDKNKTFTKSNMLSFKNSIDIHEFVHLIDTQDSATQSNIPHKISLKETQTSPRCEISNVQPIHNDLWPSIDPTREVEHLFKLEKEFIKKLIVDEYGDLIEKTFKKPSTSSHASEKIERNEHALQKNTQTSPAHVKSVMTSPKKTKSRTTSPLILSLKVNQQTSPIEVKREDKETIVQKEDYDNLSISMNLSSPRFNLRLPATSQDVMLNLNPQLYRKKQKSQGSPQVSKKIITSSSSSVDGDYSSSDISSLGEIEKKYKKMQRSLHFSTTSNQSSSSHVSNHSTELSSDILPMRSEGELSVGQVQRNRKKNKVKSEGELSLGELLRKK